ncbi:MAG: class I SAM-dependent methyltransferase [Mycobacteriaceae bacterium]|nr:class I SAM-dependent methyltransferase [Mycobacteriaceae bacterium]
MGNQHDYLPAAGNDRMLPCYDLLSRVLGTPKVHRRLLDLAGTPTGPTLEIGCGTGNLTVMARQMYPELPAADIVGTDPDPLALARAEHKAIGLTGIRFERAYAQALPYPDGSFDRARSAYMLLHLDSEVRKQAAAEVHRVLRPGGTFFVVDVGGRITPSDGFTARRMLRSHHVAGNLGDGIPQLLTGAGFARCEELHSEIVPLVGRVTYYAADR